MCSIRDCENTACIGNPFFPKDDECLHVPFGGTTVKKTEFWTKQMNTCYGHQPRHSELEVQSFQMFSIGSVAVEVVHGLPIEV
jgi:hypothetical protein